MQMNGRRRVVITGLGAVTPLGKDVESTWQGLIAGESGAGEITQFDHSDYYVHFACEAKDFEPTELVTLAKSADGKVEAHSPPAELEPIHAPT